MAAGTAMHHRCLPLRRRWIDSMEDWSAVKSSGAFFSRKYKHNSTVLDAIDRALADAQARPGFYARAEAKLQDAIQNRTINVLKYFARQS
jgi:hypothetical protein